MSILIMIVIRSYIILLGTAFAHKHLQICCVINAYQNDINAASLFRLVEIYWFNHV